MEITREELENIIRTAFDKGSIWGETYSGWFVPTADDHEEKIQEVLKLLMG